MTSDVEELRRHAVWLSAAGTRGTSPSEWDKHWLAFVQLLNPTFVLDLLLTLDGLFAITRELRSMATEWIEAGSSYSTPGRRVLAVLDTSSTSQ